MVDAVLQFLYSAIAPCTCLGRPGLGWMFQITSLELNIYLKQNAFVDLSL